MIKVYILTILFVAGILFILSVAYSQSKEGSKEVFDIYKTDPTCEMFREPMSIDKETYDLKDCLNVLNSIYTATIF